MGNDVADRLGARDDGFDGRLESREVALTADRAEHASLAVEIDMLDNIRRGKPHETLPEAPVRLVPSGNYCGIGSQAADIPRQRVLAVEVMQVDGHGAIVSSGFVHVQHQRLSMSFGSGWPPADSRMLMRIDGSAVPLRQTDEGAMICSW
ncbi:hypothetical protein ABZ941_27930 [Streptomyces rubiginosohelvolus]|uniref:hypothetical protein n=1 Tax=Streptomyces rubiginosohelvolus TaxID=67362 RepID=UPI0034055412